MYFSNIPYSNPRLQIYPYPHRFMCPYERNFPCDKSWIQPQRVAIPYIMVPITFLLTWAFKDLGPDFTKYYAVAERCAKQNPYNYDKIEECLKSNGLSGSDAIRVRKEMENVVKFWVSLKSTFHYYPSPSGVWKTQWGLLNLNLGADNQMIIFHESPDNWLQLIGREVDGFYDWARGGKVSGVLVDNILRGTWTEDPNPKAGYPNHGNFTMTIDYASTGQPIFTGMFGYEDKPMNRSWYGEKITEF